MRDGWRRVKARLVLKTKQEPQRWGTNAALQERAARTPPLQRGLPGGFHLEGVVEAVEVIEEAGNRGDFNDFAFAEMLLDAGEEFVGHVIGIEREGLRKIERGTFARIKVV